MNKEKSVSLAAVHTHTHTHTRTYGQSTKNNRLEFIDIARGIGIILMVIGHTIDEGWKRSFIFSFHMPLFIMCSGHFFNKNEKIKTTIKKVILKLFLPYILCSFIVSLILCMKGQYSFGEGIIRWLKQILVSRTFSGRFDFSKIDALGVLWFFPLLGLIRIIFTTSYKLCKSENINLSVIIVLLTYIGYLLGINKYWLPFSFDVVLASIIFYYVGYLIKEYQIIDKIEKNYLNLLIIATIWVIGIKYNWIELATRSFPNGLWSYITAIAGVITIFEISKFISKYSKFLKEILSWYGRNSMYILLFHYGELCLIPYKVKIKNPTLRKFALCSIKIFIVTIGAAFCAQVKNHFNKNNKRLIRYNMNQEISIINKENKIKEIFR